MVRPRPEDWEERLPKKMMQWVPPYCQKRARKSRERRHIKSHGSTGSPGWNMEWSYGVNVRHLTTMKDVLKRFTCKEWMPRVLTALEEEGKGYFLRLRVGLIG